jgi:DNA repair exonuclease SbcCD nuclease subunit
VKLAHLADVHLGFRQYHRLTPNGVNQREADVANAFRHAIEGVIAAAPHMVIVAGDLFNSVRPSNPAILHSFNLLRRLRSELPETPVVLIAGNHDTPRSIETGTILKLFEAVGGVHVVSDGVRDLVFDDLDCCVTCVPHMAWVSGPRPTLAPPSGVKRRVLATHGEVAGVLPRDAWAMEYGGAVLEPSELRAEEWDYVALGHYHVAHQVADNAWYSGALDYVSSNPWGEVEDEAREGREGQKGWLLVELGRKRRVTLQPVPLPRRPISFPAIHATGLAATAIDEQIREHVAAVPHGVDDQIVRQVIYDVPRPIARDLDYAMIRELKARALHFHLDARRPQSPREVGVAAPGARQTLTEVVTDYLQRRLLDADVDRDRLVALGNRYMTDIEQALREE